MIFVVLHILDPPEAPEKPEILDITANSMVVTWKEPNDNGSPIQGYWVEKREINSTHWARVNRNLIDALEVKVEGLLEGLTYIFRVSAENVAGCGKFSPPSDPKTAQAPICKIIISHQSNTDLEIIVALMVDCIKLNSLFFFFSTTGSTNSTCC